MTEKGALPARSTCYNCSSPVVNLKNGDWVHEETGNHLCYPDDVAEPDGDDLDYLEFHEWFE